MNSDRCWSTRVNQPKNGKNSSNALSITKKSSPASRHILHGNNRAVTKHRRNCSPQNRVERQSCQREETRAPAREAEATSSSTRYATYKSAAAIHRDVAKLRKRSADSASFEVPRHQGFDFGYRPTLSDTAQGLG